MENQIEHFIQERVYLTGVSAATVRWYRSSFKAFAGALDSPESAKLRIVELRNRGLTPVSVNVHLRCVNAFWKWQGKDWKIPRLKEEQKLLSTLQPVQIAALVSYKPKGRNETRAHVLALTILDTGLRASEVLGLTKEQVDIENLVFHVMGKGGKHRLVPFSGELRKLLWRYLSKLNGGILPKTYVFGTKNNTKLSVRNFERDLKVLGQKIGIAGVRFSPHTLRHTFAVNYLRRGGNLEYLRNILGHSSIITTQKYLRSLGIDDLAAVHNSLSILSQVRGSGR